MKQKGSIGRDVSSTNANKQDSLRNSQHLDPSDHLNTMATPGDRSNFTGDSQGNSNRSYREQGFTALQPTLGQMADQFQERARAEARHKGSGEDPAPNYNDYGGGNGDDYNYDEGSGGGGGGSAGMDGYDDDEDGDGGDGGDDDPSLIATGNESTGRWTRPEHELFLQALKKYGKEWKKVASMVKTRTVVQTRTHAQKYFQKLTKGAPSNYQQRADTSSNSGGSGQKGSTSALFYHKQGKGRGKISDMASPMMSMHYGMADPTASLSAMKNSQYTGGNGHPSHIYMDADPQDYYDSIDLAQLVGELHKTPASSQQMQMQTPLSLGLPMINTASIGPPDFPEPSPAACGKRKHAELQAAQMLAASSSSKSRPRPSEGDSAAADGGTKNSAVKLEIEDQASAMAREKAQRVDRLMRDSSAGSLAASNFHHRKNRLGLTLSIVDPNEDTAGSHAGQEPGTPWESAIQALEQQSSSGAPISRLMRSNSFSNYTMPAVPVSTPSEQRNFINKVRTLVKDADLAGFASLLGAAEYSAQAHAATGAQEPAEQDTAPGMHLTPIVEGDGASPVPHAPKGNNAADGISRLGAEAPVSNLMSEYTPGPSNKVDQAEGKGDFSDSNTGEPMTPKTARLRREEAMNTQLNSSTSVQGGSTRRLSSSLVAKSLNRMDRNAKSVLMDVAATGDPSINQTLLYSMCMLLMEHGASPSLVDSTGNTALHYAAIHGHERIGRLLLTKGCPLNLQNMQGDTATHIAARNGRAAFIEMLADLGANFHIRNGSSICALDLAGSNTKDAAQRDALRKVMLAAEPRLRSLVLYHEDFQEHTARRPSDWEGPDRLDGIMRRLRDKAEFPEYELEISNRFEKADVVLLGRVHSPEYIAFVNMLSKQVQQEAQELIGHDGIPGAPQVLPFTPQVQRFVMRQNSEELKSSEGSDTSFSVGTLKAARRAAGAVAHAVDRVMLGRNRNVFCAVRPPGHHAGYRGLLDGANSCGFCIFNSVAAGALHALEEHQCERVAIIDLDVHHGNGTEDIVRRYSHPSRLFFFSLHLYEKEDGAQQQNNTHHPAVVKTTTDRPIDAVTTEAEAVGGAAAAASAANAAAAARKYEFYPGTGVKDDHVHNIINVPLTPLWAKDEPVGSAHRPPNSALGQFVGREGYRQAIELRLIPSLRAFNPTLILLSIGFDAAAGDVGNRRLFPGEGSRMGIDLLPEDFAWATTEIMKIADICCGGRLVSVLEGGYGEYATASPKPAAAPAAPTTRGAARHTSAAPAPAVVESDKKESAMNRGLLAKVAAAHVHRLMDPYGPSSHLPVAPPS